MCAVGTFQSETSPQEFSVEYGGLWPNDWPKTTGFNVQRKDHAL
jgi:hypothetical protein